MDSSVSLLANTAFGFAFVAFVFILYVIGKDPAQHALSGTNIDHRRDIA